MQLFRARDSRMAEAELSCGRSFVSVVVYVEAGDKAHFAKRVRGLVLAGAFPPTIEFLAGVFHLGEEWSQTRASKKFVHKLISQSMKSP